MEMKILWGAMIIKTVVNGFNYKALTKNNLHLPAVTCRPTAYNSILSGLEWACVLDLPSGELQVGSEGIITAVSFNQFSVHSYCIINLPEVQQLDGVGVWITESDVCVGGLTVAAILTAQIHK